MAALLNVQPESQVVDLGCGPHCHTLVEVAAQLGPGGSIVGVDRDIQSAPRQLATDPRLTLLSADLARKLPWQDEQFDRAICHNVLEALADPDALLAEVSRILTPGGLFVLSHNDFDTIVFASQDVALTRRLVHHFCDSGARGRCEGTIGRKLAGIASRSSLQIERILANTDVGTVFENGSPGYEVAHAVAGIARRGSTMPSDMIDGWLGELRELAEDDAFLYSVTVYTVICRKVQGGVSR